MLKWYKLKLIFASPVHIGSGEELEPLDYVISDNIFYKLNLHSLIASLPQNKKEELKSYINNNKLIQIRKFIKDNFIPDKFSEFQTYASDSVSSIYKEKFTDINNQLLIKPFIRTQSKIFLPASSLKGALRTAFLNYLANTKQIDISSVDKKNYSKNIEGLLLNSIKINKEKNKISYKFENDPFRAIKLKDIPLPQSSEIVKIINFNIHSKTNKLQPTKIQQFYEVFPKLDLIDKTEIQFEIGFDEDLFNKLSIFKVKIDLETLLKASDEFYRKMLNSEKERLFQNVSDINLKKIAEKYDELINSTNCYLLRVGFGSGKEFVTIEKFRFPQNPERFGKNRWGFSKNIIENISPLGIVKILY